jgi:DNA gyrase/topoisomerase IV subunit A
MSPQNIIHMILVNGWSCNIPCYNPKDLFSCIKKLIDNNDKNNIQDLPNLIPWYRGFKGVF